MNALSPSPVDSRRSPYARLSTLGYNSVRFDHGFWTRRQALNREVGLEHGSRMLEQSGAFENFRLAAGNAGGDYRLPEWRDQDVYKWLESAAYEVANDPSGALQREAGRAIDAVVAAQDDDGYLHTYHQVVAPAQRWADLGRNHEMFCAGHLIEAALAFRRVLGNDTLLRVARRFADHIGSVFGTDRKPGAPGHPEIELALVELYRATGERPYLELAQFFIDQRGHGVVGAGWYNDPKYHQDHLPVRQATAVEGHAVRQLYLTAGVTDVYLETGEQALLDAVMRQWQDMTSGKLHITGGVGARHEWEAFGEPYELPNDRCYCETCAAIGSIMWNWRLLLATGDGRFADLIERTLYNALLSGVSLEGRTYFYGNVLLSRGGIERKEWFDCACCPPNLTRVLASLAHYFATGDANGLQVHQYAPGTISALQGRIRLDVETAYPWEGNVRFTVRETDSAPWTLQLRVPAWCKGATVAVNAQASQSDTAQGYVSIERVWRAGDTVELELPMVPRLVEAHPRNDSTRDSAAIERGPIVYCLEACDQDPSVNLLDVQLDDTAPLVEQWRGDMLEGVVSVEAQGFVCDPAPWGDELYKPLGAAGDLSRAPLRLTAIPYYAWANRGPHAMRVWIPRAAG